MMLYWGKLAKKVTRKKRQIPARKLSDTDQDYDESDNKSDVGNDYEDDEDSDKHDYDNNDVGDNEGLQISDILCTTKSGKTCGTWKARYLFY